MKLLLVVDSHLYKTPDGKYWCMGLTDYTFMKRYVNVFGKVKLVSRVQKIKSIEEGKFLRVDGPGIEVFDMPFTRGAKEYIKKYFEIQKLVKIAISDCDCAMFRLPSVLSSLVLDKFKKLNRPYSIEVVADPDDAYKDNEIARRLYTKKLKKSCIEANGVSYVTQYYLQNKYESYSKLHGESSSRFTTYYSSIDLSKEFFGTPKKYDNKKEYVLCHTANISSSNVKGQDILIKALGEIIRRGYKARIQFIGDSNIKNKYYEIAKENKVDELISFTGMLPSKAQIREKLLEGDIFVLPTKAEGLPRSIIEAMAVGLPCLSTPVNGIPELLSTEFMISQSDYKGFADAIIKMIENPIELEKISSENIEIAKEYINEKLDVRRNMFYKKLYDLTLAK